MTQLAPSIGSIEGRLLLVEGEEGEARIAIYDRLRSQTVLCAVPDELLSRAFGAVDARVIVRGEIRSWEDGASATIDVRHIEVMPADHDLPPWQDVRGMLCPYKLAGDA